MGLHDMHSLMHSLMHSMMHSMSEENVQLIERADHRVRMDARVGIVHLPIQLALPAKPDAVHADLLRTPDVVAQAVAQHRRRTGRHIEQREGMVVDARVGLADAKIARGDDYIEVAAERRSSHFLTL